MRRFKITTAPDDLDPVTGKPHAEHLGYGIRVTDADTGEIVPEVFSIKLHAVPDEILRATIEVNLSELDVMVEGEVVGVCRACGHRVPEGRWVPPLSGGQG